MPPFDDRGARVFSPEAGGSIFSSVSFHFRVKIATCMFVAQLVVLAGQFGELCI